MVDPTADGAHLAGLLSPLLSNEFMLSKAAFAAALVLLLVLMRLARPRKRVIFNF
jgi:hypothetical protein